MYDKESNHDFAKHQNKYNATLQVTILCDTLDLLGCLGSSVDSVSNVLDELGNLFTG